MLDRGLRQYAVTEIENMRSIAMISLLKILPDGVVPAPRPGDQRQRIEIALKRRGSADRSRINGWLGGPVDADGIGAGRVA